MDITGEQDSCFWVFARSSFFLLILAVDSFTGEETETQRGKGPDQGTHLPVADAGLLCLARRCFHPGPCCCLHAWWHPQQLGATHPLEKRIHSLASSQGPIWRILTCPPSLTRPFLPDGASEKDAGFRDWETPSESSPQLRDLEEGRAGSKMGSEQPAFSSQTDTQCRTKQVQKSKCTGLGVK